MKITKNIHSLFLLLFVFAFLAVSCQNEENELKNENPETLNGFSELTTQLKRVSNTETIDDNILDSMDCYKIKLPVEVMVNDQFVLVAAEDDYQIVADILNQSDQDEDTISFNFPITLIYSNNEELNVSNEEQYNILKNDCDFPNSGMMSCISLNYPITIFGYDSTQQIQDTYVIENDIELFLFLLNLGNTEMYSISYPISVTNSAGQNIVIDSNVQLLSTIESALTNCNPSQGECQNPNILTDGLIMYIPFSNETKDLTGFGIPDLEGMTHYVTDRNGNSNGAISFDEVTMGNRLKVSGTPENNMMQNGKFTISLWFNRQNPDPMVEFQMFEQLMSSYVEPVYAYFGIHCGIRNLDNPTIGPIVVSSNLLGLPLYENSWFDNPGMIGELGVWHHIAVTWDGQILKLFRDGDLKAQSPGPQLGSDMGGTSFGSYFKGYLDDIRIYNKSLSATEIKILSNLSGDINKCY